MEVIDEYKQEVYHGGYQSIEEPQIIKGRFTKDFGEGFYCTIIKHQAVRWANRHDTPIVSIYDYSENQSLNIKKFDVMTDEWLDFVADCRAGKSHNFDIVIGPMADDQIYNYVDDFISGVISREQFWAMARFKYPTNQICFCTLASLRCLTFKTSESCQL